MTILAHRELVLCELTLMNGTNYIDHARPVWASYALKAERSTYINPKPAVGLHTYLPGDFDLMTGEVSLTLHKSETFERFNNT